MLAQPTWQGIPVEVKKDIVELLDYKSRFRLRVCSKIDKALVDGSPFHISQILFHMTDPFAYCFLLVTNQGIEVRITTNAVEHFVNIFMQKRSVVAEVKIVCSAQSWLINRTKEADTPLIRLIYMIESLGPDFKIRTREIDIFIRGIEEYYYLEVLQLFDPKFLESITLSKGSACCASNYIEDFYSCHPRYHGPVLDIRECDQRQRTLFKQDHIVRAERRQRSREQAVFDNYGDYFQYGSYSIRSVNIYRNTGVVHEPSEPASQEIPFNPDASLYIPSFSSVV